MLIFDLIIVILSFVMLIVVMPMIRRKMTPKHKIGVCDDCKCSLTEDIENAISDSERERAVTAFRRGTCDDCKIQNEREEQLKEVFSPNAVSIIKRKVDTIVRKKYTGAIFFLSSAFFGILPVHGSMLLITKSLQVLLLILGWTVLVISLKKK